MRRTLTVISFAILGAAGCASGETDPGQSQGSSAALGSRDPGTGVDPASCEWPYDIGDVELFGVEQLVLASAANDLEPVTPSLGRPRVGLYHAECVWIVPVLTGEGGGVYEYYVRIGMFEILGFEQIG